MRNNPSKKRASPPPPIDLNLLVVLDALLERGSVTGAAKALGLTQPTVSHALGRIRRALSDPIFVRAGRGVVKTPRAEALGPAVRRLVADARRVLTEETSFEPATSARSFTVACPDILVAFLPELLGRIAREAPNVKLVVSPPPADLATHLGSAAIDVAVLPARDDGPGLVQRVIGRVHWCVLARRGHPAIEEGHIDMAAWLRHPHVQVHTAEGTGLVRRALDHRGHERRIAFVAPSFLSALASLAHTDWFFAAPRELVAPLAKGLGLALLDPPMALPAVSVAVVWHERMSADPGHQWLRGVLVEAIGKALAPRTT